MNPFSTHPVLRWAVPSVAAVAVAGGTAMSGVLSASAGSDLPHRSAAQLLVDVHTARLDAISGTIVQRADLGLPDVSGLTGSGTGSSGSSSFSSMVSGTHTVRLWYAGPDKTRVALMGSLGESDVVHNGRDVWQWSSKDNTATHVTLPAQSASTKPGAKAPSSADASLTPQQAADKALAAIGKSTVVTTASATVAGRSAYELVLAPKDTASLVGQVRIAIDGARHVPLRVQAFAKGSTTPAFEVGFSQVDFGAPDASEFRFTPPPGAKVTQQKLPAMTDARKAPAGAKGKAPMPKLSPGEKAQQAQQRPTVVGTGWTSIVVARMQPGATAGQATSGAPGAAGKAAPTSGGKGAFAHKRAGSNSADQLTALLGRLPKVSGSWGSGRVLRGTLFSVLLTDDGRILAGAVTPDALYAAAAK